MQSIKEEKMLYEDTGTLKFFRLLKQAKSFPVLFLIALNFHFCALGRKLKLKTMLSISALSSAAGAPGYSAAANKGAVYIFYSSFYSSGSSGITAGNFTSASSTVTGADTVLTGSSTNDNFGAALPEH